MTEVDQEYNYTPLPKPARITEQHWPEGTVPLVSIRCITYNHVNFIRDAIEGFLMQETTFPVEILIHDDASTDGTADIVREYEAQYPQLFMAIYQTENQYSKGNKPGQFLRPQLGRYIAICEGDDYWTDAEKLQRQVLFLNDHNDYSAATENSLWVDCFSNTEYLFGTNVERDITIDEMLEKRPFGTASVLARKVSLHGREAHFKVAGDIGSWCYLAKQGRIKYFPNVSSVYRRGTHGVVMGTPKLLWAMKMEEWNRELASFLEGEVQRSVFNKRNFGNYYGAFVYSVKAKHVKDTLFSGAKALRFSPVRFIKKASKMFLKRIPGLRSAWQLVRRF